MPVGVFENPDLLLTASLPGTTAPKRTKVHHLCTKGVECPVVPAERFPGHCLSLWLVQHFILKNCKLHSGSVCVQTAEKRVHTPYTRLPETVSALEASTQQQLAEEPHPPPTALS